MYAKVEDDDSLIHVIVFGSSSFAERDADVAGLYVPSQSLSDEEAQLAYSKHDRLAEKAFEARYHYELAN